MEFRNLTPFAAMQFAMLDVNDVEKNVVVVKVGYQLRPSGDGHYAIRLREDDAVPLCPEDVFTGALNTSSVLQESDLAPFKPACDVIVHATAWAPKGQPCTEIPVSVEIKNAEGALLLSKQLQVSGDRYVRQHAVTGQWSMSEPEPFTHLPLTWEAAFGGQCRIEAEEQTPGKVPDAAALTPAQRAQHPQAPDAPLAHEACMHNPLGTGFITPWYGKARQPERYPAPRITDPTHPFTADDFAALIAGKTDMTAPQFRPAGLGIVGRGWQPRIALAGTYDAAWLEKRHPYLPADFDFRYWNAAPADQQITYPDPAFSVTLKGLSPDGSQHFTFPDHLAFILLRMKNGTLLPQKMHLDTLYIDTERLEVTACWRFLLPADEPVRVMELRYETEPGRAAEKIYPMLFTKTAVQKKEL